MADSYRAEFISKIIDGICSNKDVIISNFSSLSEANNDSITFYNDPSFKTQLLNTNAGLVILKESDLDLCNKPTIVVKDPYIAFAKASSLFHKKRRLSKIHETVIFTENVVLGKNLFIEPYVFVDSNAMIGDDTFVGSNTHIGSNAKIGKNVTIHSNVYIGDDVKIGNNCEIFPGARIGTDGFGYAREENKKWLKIPQTGSVIIGNEVDVGSNTTIDRGAIDNTVIHDGVKIDNLVQIGHNCIIGENSIIAGCAGIAGSAIVGKNCMIGGAAMIKGHITIADDTIISGGTGIGKNIENPGKRFTNVFPYNLEHKDWLRIANNLKKLGKKND